MPRLRFAALVVLVPTLAWAAPNKKQPAAQTAPPAPLSEYSEKTIAGFRVFIHRQVFEAKGHFAEAPLTVLENQFREVKKAIPAPQLEFLQPRVRVFVEWDHVEAGNEEAVGVYRGGSSRSMRLKGLLPEKANAVEIISLKRITQAKQPSQNNPTCVLLHELAHAFHHQYLGTDNPVVLGAYQQAMDRKLYESVKNLAGREVKAYAATNEYEYFAELSEAYLARNDFFPFNRDELRDYDPIGFQLMQRAWSVDLELARSLRHKATMEDLRAAAGKKTSTPRRDPESDKKAADLLRQAKYQIADSRFSTARQMLESLIKSYPGAPASAEATRLLAAIRGW